MTTPIDIAVQLSQRPDTATRPPSPTVPAGTVVIGRLVHLTGDAGARVEFPGSPAGVAVAAISAGSLRTEHVGREVALLFEGGDPRRPIVVGPVARPEQSEAEATVEKDGERLELTAEREIVLRCGKASLTLTRAGKVLLRGAYVLSRSSGVNRIKGGSVQIN